MGKKNGCMPVGSQRKPPPTRQASPDLVQRLLQRLGCQGNGGQLAVLEVELVVIPAEERLRPGPLEGSSALS